MKEEHNDLIEFLKSVPNIPYNVRGKEFKSKCYCGGTITAWRVEYNGHLRAKCDKCNAKIIE